MVAAPYSLWSLLFHGQEKSSLQIRILKYVQLKNSWQISPLLNSSTDRFLKVNVNCYKLSIQCICLVIFLDRQNYITCLFVTFTGNQCIENHSMGNLFKWLVFMFKAEVMISIRIYIIKNVGTTICLKLGLSFIHWMSSRQ